MAKVELDARTLRCVARRLRRDAARLRAQAKTRTKLDGFTTALKLSDVLTASQLEHHAIRAEEDACAIEKAKKGKR